MRKCWVNDKTVNPTYSYPVAFDLSAKLKSVEQVDTVGGYDDGMEIRVANLEADVKRLQTDITEVKVKLKALHIDVHGLIKWIVGTGSGLGVAGITVMTFVLNNATPRTAPQSQPIIINIPAQTQPPAKP